MLPGCRSSDFFWRVHLLVAVSTASRMSLAMLRGRLVIGLVRIISEDDRAFASVRILDVGRCQLQGVDHRRRSVGSPFGQRALQPCSGRSEAAEGIVDPDAPIRAGDEPAGYSATVLRQRRLM